MSKHRQLQLAVLADAQEILDHAAYLPEGIAQVPSEIAEKLFGSLMALQDFERRLYASQITGEHQVGLNADQVAAQRLGMEPHQLAIELAIDAADKLYLAFFDVVEVPGYRYLSSPISETKEIQYAHREHLDRLAKCLDAVKI